MRDPLFNLLKEDFKKIYGNLPRPQAIINRMESEFRDAMSKANKLQAPLRKEKEKQKLFKTWIEARGLSNEKK